MVAESPSRGRDPDHPFGFSPDGTAPWLPQPPKWRDLTVGAQSDDPYSTLSLYRKALRRRSAVQGSQFSWIDAPTGVLAYSRGVDLAVVVNLSPNAVGVPADCDVIVSSSSCQGDPVPPGCNRMAAPARNPADPEAADRGAVMELERLRCRSPSFVKRITDSEAVLNASKQASIGAGRIGALSSHRTGYPGPGIDQCGGESGSIRENAFTGFALTVSCGRTPYDGPMSARPSVREDRVAATRQQIV